MLGAIIGDIAGSRFEFNNYKAKDFQFLHSRCKPTDDSLMTLAVAEAILSCKPDRSDLPDQAVRCMQEIGRRYPHAGYGNRFSRWLELPDPRPYGSFGNGGTVDTSVGMGQITAGYVMHTSGPLVAGERIVMGAWIADGMTVGEPSGVVRAWNARTGELDWAWDLGRPDIDKLPPPG